MPKRHLAPAPTPGSIRADDDLVMRGRPTNSSICRRRSSRYRPGFHAGAGVAEVPCRRPIHQPVAFGLHLVRSFGLRFLTARMRTA